MLAGEITVGTLAEYLAFMAILQMPVRQLGMMVNAFARASMSGGRLFEVLDREPEIADRPGARDLVISDAVLRFENVSFAYPGARTRRQLLATLHDISFEVRAGQTLGIVGPPGSGKSTIAHLIPRYYDVGAGRITIDGQDVRDVTLASLRRAVSLVQQDTFLFTASIENNIAYGDPWAERERIAQSSEVARLHDYIAGLPGGYETLVGERGVSLSGGQRQRLSIARSILLAPPILVFDDSTAAVDAATEQSIREALRTQTATRATIIIAHRLGSLMDADEIVFLEQGRIVERGSHAELLAPGRPLRQPLCAAERRRRARGGQRHERRLSAGAHRGRGWRASRSGRRARWSARRSTPRSRSSPPSTAGSCARFWHFISPYRRRLVLAVLAVLVFAASQISDSADRAQRDRRRAGRRTRATSGC